MTKKSDTAAVPEKIRPGMCVRLASIYRTTSIMRQLGLKNRADAVGLVIQKYKHSKVGATRDEIWEVLFEGSVIFPLEMAIEAAHSELEDCCSDLISDAG